MKKIFLLLLAVLAVKFAGRALKHEAEVLAALWTLVGMTAMAGATAGPKARSTEDRLNALVPVVFPNTGGTISGSVTVTGNHAVNGQLNVGGSSSSATVAVGGSVHASAAGQFDGGVTTSTVTATGGSTSEFSGSIHTAGNHVVDGSLSASNFSGTYHGSQGAVSSVSGAPGSYSATYETSLASAINGIIARLNSAGIT